MRIPIVTGWLEKRSILSRKESDEWGPMKKVIPQQAPKRAEVAAGLILTTSPTPVVVIAGAAVSAALPHSDFYPPILRCGVCNLTDLRRDIVWIKDGSRTAIAGTDEGCGPFQCRILDVGIRQTSFSAI